MNILKWIKFAGIFVLAGSLAVSSIFMIHASNRLQETDTARHEEPKLVSEGVTDAASPKEDEEMPNICGALDGTDKMPFACFSVTENTAEGCRLRIENSSATHMLTTGYAFWLEVKKGGEFVPVDFITTPVFPDIAFLVKPGRSAEINYDWHASYGSLAPGEYRLVTEYFLENAAFTGRTPFTVK